MLAYVHGSLSIFSPYIQTIFLSISKKYNIFFYNLYNSLLMLPDEPPGLPQAFFVVGDFNLHSPNWGPSS